MMTVEAKVTSKKFGLMYLEATHLASHGHSPQSRSGVLFFAGPMRGDGGDVGVGENREMGGNAGNAVNAVHRRTARNVRDTEMEGMRWDSRQCASRNVGQQERRLDTVACERRRRL